MSNKGQIRPVPHIKALPKPVYARPESWGSEGSITEWHTHTWGQFSYVSLGVLHVDTARVSYVSPPSYGIWIPANVEHKVSSHVAAEMRSLYIDTSLLDGERWTSPFICTVTPLCRELIVRFCQNPADYQVASKEARQVDVLLDELRAQPSVALELPQSNDPRIVQICRLLRSNPNSGQDIHQLGSVVGLSGRSVSRLFKRQTGLTFQQWRQRLRLSLALTWLEAGKSVTEVAMDCGYDSLSAFVVAFKQHFGQTPGNMF